MSQKIYYNNFIGGLSYSDKGGPGSSYFAGSEVNPVQAYPFGYYNYLVPERVPTNIDGMSAVTDLIVAMQLDPNTDNNYIAYGVGNAGKFYKVRSTLPEYVSGGGSWPYQISAGVDGYHGGSAVGGDDLLNYKIGTTDYMLYSWDTDVSGSVGTFNLETTFDDDFMALSAAGAGMLSAAVPHPMIEGDNGNVYIGNGNKLSSFDGQTGTYGTYTSNCLDLPVGMEITSLFKVNDYLGITAWKKMIASGLNTKSYVYLWDYVSESFNQVIPIDDNKITSSFNHNGTVYLFTTGRDKTFLKRLDSGGVKTIKRLHYITSSIDSWSLNPPKNKAVETMGSRVYFGTDGGYNCVFSYGNEFEDMNKSTVLNYMISGTNGNIGMIKPYYTNKMYFSDYNGDGVYHLKKYDAGTNAYSTTAYWAGLFTDFGQKVRINYIKYFFKPLASGDILTPTISLDYGTAIALSDPVGVATITYSEDGAITSKRFNVKRDCYTISPRLAWTGGSATVQKIEIDYSPISDI